MLKLIDGNNIFRIESENDITGLPTRKMAMEALAPTSPTIWVWDGKDSRKRRREIYPEYKNHRKPGAESLYAAMEVLKRCLDHTPVIQIEVPGYEADDVIATLARRHAPCAIYSNDLDFYQLTGEDPRIVCGCRKRETVPAPLVRLYKTTVGDASDNIPGIKGFGPKTWDEADKARLLRAMKRWVQGEVRGGDADLMSKASFAWLQENATLVGEYWRIVGFFDVPITEINHFTSVGKADMAKINDILQEFLI